MKSIMRKISVISITAILALGMLSCKIGVDGDDAGDTSSSTDTTTSNDSGTPSKETVATPTFSVAAGAVQYETEVTISCTTSGAKIYYTTDGSAPKASSKAYTSAITITDAVTIKAIAVKDGMNDSAVASASYTIAGPDYSKCVIGDFILTDGTILSKDETPASNTVAAVIVRAATAEKPALGVGLVPSESYLKWCTADAVGKDKTIEAMVGNINTGYSDGSNGWEILKDACSDAEEHPEYYPAWEYCLEYGITQDFEGNLATGWYFPTAVEMETISNNLTTINSSIEKAGKAQLIGWYISCSVDDTSTRFIAKLLGSTGSGTRTRTDSEGKVCAVRAFK